MPRVSHSTLDYACGRMTRQQVTVTLAKFRSRELASAREFSDATHTTLLRAPIAYRGDMRLRPCFVVGSACLRRIGSAKSKQIVYGRFCPGSR